MYNASGLEYYGHSDWLGSSRLASTASRAVYYDGAYAAYGENYAEAGTQDRNFTGQDQDIVPSGAYPLYDFLMREYHPTWGRWLSPDPAGLAAASPGNPQSWNRYGYVINNPTNLVDPLGLDSWAPKLCERTANCDMTIFSGSYDLFLGGYYAEFGLLNIPVYASGWYWDADGEPYGAWTYGPVQVGYASDYLLGDFFPADGQPAGPGGSLIGASQLSKLVSENNDSEFSDELVECVIFKESGTKGGVNPNAVTRGSSARGLMQITRPAAFDVANHYTGYPNGATLYSELFDPATNIQVGSDYLDLLQSRFMSTSSTLAHYYGSTNANANTAYANDILNCEQKLQHGDTAGAISAAQGH